MNGVLLSILIPTKNRKEYCLEAIQTMLPLLDENCEIVIQDNSAEKKLEELLIAINDKRIVYNYRKEHLSYADNFNQAIEHSTGEYLCLIGDDDCVTVAINSVVKWMKANEVESVCQKNIVEYIWPNPNIEQFKTGELRIPQFSGSRNKLDIQPQLSKLLRNGIINYQLSYLPRLYHGIIKRSCLEEVKNKTGHYIGGLSPDIYATMTLSCVVNSHYVIDAPFTIAGACPASGTMANMQGKHSGELKDAPHFRGVENYEWEKVVPAYYSVETIWAETALKALKEIGRMDLYREFNPYRFMAFSIISNRRNILQVSIRESLNLADQLKVPFVYHSLRISFGFLGWGMKKLLRVLKNKGPRYAVKTNVLSLKDADMEIEKLIV